MSAVEFSPLFGDRFDWRPKKGWRPIGVLYGQTCAFAFNPDRRRGVEFTPEMLEVEQRKNDLLEHLFERMAKKGLSIVQMGQRLGIGPGEALDWIEKFRWTDPVKLPR